MDIHFPKIVLIVIISGMNEDYENTGGVVFDEEKVERIYKPTDSKIIRFVIKMSGGLIKDGKQASVVLLVVSIIFFAISGYLFFNMRSSSPVAPTGIGEGSNLP